MTTQYKLQSTRVDKKPTWVAKIDGEVTLNIPFDPDNTDYQEYLKWVAEGNEPLPADE
jgi:hypothetical protein